MKIKFYIVTYNRQRDLNLTMQSLLNSDLFSLGHEVQLFIVNNHSNFQLDPQYAPMVTVLHNVLRPDFSCGHLSRNYNEILIHGFKNPAEPDCDLVMHSHDDNLFHPDFLSQLLVYHQNYDLLTFSQGCGFMSYTPKALRTIGMWDERFCTIGYHEGDYFLRGIKYMGDRISINDPNQLRVWNPLPHIVTKIPDTHLNTAHRNSQVHYSVCRQLFEKKWGTVKDTGYPANLKALIPTPLIPMYMMYPYFEKFLDNLGEMYYTDIDLNGRKFLCG